MVGEGFNPTAGPGDGRPVLSPARATQKLARRALQGPGYNESYAQVQRRGQANG